MDYPVCRTYRIEEAVATLIFKPRSGSDDENDSARDGDVHGRVQSLCSPEVERAGFQVLGPDSGKKGANKRVFLAC